MWLLTEDNYISTSAIARLVDDGKDGAVIHLVNGEKIRTDRSIDEIAIQTGAIIAAQAGFEAAWSDQATGKLDREPIVCWRITGPDDAMVPMVPSGRTAWASIIYPSGRVRDRDGRFFADVDTWSAALFEQQQRKAKTAQMAE